MQFANWFQHVKRNNAKMQCRLHYWMHKQLHMHMKEQHAIAIVDIARNYFGSSVQVKTFKTNPGIKDGQHQRPESDFRISVTM